MKVTRLEDAAPYSAARHTATVHAMHLQHQVLGSTAPFWVGCSYYLPGARAEWDSGPLHRIYVVLDGELTVAFEGEQFVLGPLDSVTIEPGERREVRNDTNRVATMLVVMPYPEATGR